MSPLLPPPGRSGSSVREVPEPRVRSRSDGGGALRRNLRPVLPGRRRAGHRRRRGPRHLSASGGPPVADARVAVGLPTGSRFVRRSDGAAERGGSPVPRGVPVVAHCRHQARAICACRTSHRAGGRAPRLWLHDTTASAVADLRPWCPGLSNHAVVPPPTAVACTPNGSIGSTPRASRGLLVTGARPGGCRSGGVSRAAPCRRPGRRRLRARRQGVADHGPVA